LNIIIIANDIDTIFNFREEIIQDLVLNDCSVKLVYPVRDENSVEKIQSVEHLNWRLSRKSVNPLLELISFLRLFFILKRNKPDIIMSFTIKPNLYSSIISKLLRVHNIVNITGLGSFIYSKSYFSKVFMKLQVYFYNRSSHVFFQNNSNEEIFTSYGFRNDKKTILPGSGVNLNKFTYYMPKLDRNSGTDFLMVARIRRDKGIYEFLDIVRAKQNEESCRFHLVGSIEEASLVDKIIEYTKSYNLVYYGNVDRETLIALYRSCDCLIHPSYHEGMSNVILEAGAVGRPAIVSNIPGCSDIISENINGFLFEPMNTEELLYKVNVFLELSTRKMVTMSRMCRKIVESKFNRDIVVDKYRNVIKSI